MAKNKTPCDGVTARDVSVSALWTILFLVIYFGGILLFIKYVGRP
jgi:hypothetical protein